MHVGLQINKFTWPDQPKLISETLKQIAIAADNAGFYSLWVIDHFFQIGYIGKPEEPLLEAYTTLGFLASITKRVKLGTLVTGFMYRKPGLFAKEVTTLDVLSKGRAYMAIGVVGNEEESRALGFAFPLLTERFHHLEEVLQVIHQMWKRENHTVDRPLHVEQQISKPHPPILVGGSGEKKTLRLVAQYANACNLQARLGKNELQRKLSVLHQHCKEVGRNYEEIEKTVFDHINEINDPQTIIQRCKDLRDIGFDHIIFDVSNVETYKPIDIFKETIIPAVTKL